MFTLLLIRIKHAADDFNRGIDTRGNFAIGGFEAAYARGGFVKFAGEPRAIAAQRMKLIGHGLSAAIGLAAPLGRRVQGIERKRKPRRCGRDQIGLAQLDIGCGHRYRLGTLREYCVPATIYREKLTSYRGKASTACVRACA
jgi:hypothetical protein